MTDLSTGVFVASGIYVAMLLVIGFVSRQVRASDSLSDFYLAGRRLGPTVLLLTLFATQYSGNSLSGFPGQTYREGLTYYMSVTFMVAIVTGYLLFAPRLFKLARQSHFVTPTDFLAERFRSPVLSYLSAGILCVTLINFLLAQLMAMGHAFSGLTDGRVPYWAGVVGGAVVILVYELLGGMRAVAWTDALQGALLVGGLLFASALLFRLVGTPVEVIAQIEAIAPAKVAMPTLQTCAIWFSNFVLLGLGGPIYPQAIQRIYAARSLADLRGALAKMAWIPHVAITTVVFIGLAGIVLFPDLKGTEADGVTFRVLAYLVEQDPIAYIPVLVVMMAVLAAIMSTADSCLLSLSSIVTKDLVARAKGLSDSQAERLTRVGSTVSVLIMAGLVLVALRPVTTLWNLLVIKFEILIQLSPAFVLGTLHSKDDPRAFDRLDILAGLATGLALALTLHFSGQRTVGGLHAGTLGVLLNYVVVVVTREIRLRTFREA